MVDNCKPVTQICCGEHAGRLVCGVLFRIHFPFLLKIHWTLTFLNNQPFPPLGIYTELTQPVKKKVWMFVTQYLDSIGLST